MMMKTKIDPLTLQIKMSVSSELKSVGHTQPVTTPTAATTAPVQQVTGLPTTWTSSSPMTELGAKVSACFTYITGDAVKVR